MDYDDLAIKQIKAIYNDACIIKSKTLLKFGENKSVGTTQATIMELAGAEASETYVSDNLITHIISDNAANVGAFYIEGHTISGSDLTFVTQTGTLTGLTAVPLTTPLARATRLQNAGSVDLAASSKVYVYQGGTTTLGVPDDATGVHLIMNNDENQSLKAATALSSVDYALINNVYGSINKKAGAVFADIRLRIREPGGVFQTKFKTGLETDGAGMFSVDFEPYIIAPKNSDIILTAEASAAATSVTGGFNAKLALVV